MTDEQQWEDKRKEIQRVRDALNFSSAVSLRDQFAMAAVSSLASAANTPNATPDSIARFVYQIADAMMEARQK